MILSASGFFLLVVAILIPFISIRVRKNAGLILSIGIVLAVKQIITFLQITIGPLPTVNADPIAFNAYASYAGAEHLGGNSYVRFLRSVYDILGGSHLLGCEINQIGFSLALVAFIEIIYLTGYQAYASQLVLIFGFLPSVLLNSSVVLREGLQMAGFLWMTWGVLHIRRFGINQRNLGAVGLAAVALVNLQNGFAPHLLLVLPVALLWATGTRPWLVVCAISAGLFVITFFGGRIFKALEARSTVIQQVVEGEGLEYIGGYQSRVNEGRSDFATKLDLSSPGALIKTGPIVALQYLFAPAPWQVRGILDLYGLFESFIRLNLFWYALLSMAKTSRERRQELVFLFAIFLSMELVWSAGTSNWGTAFRHRVVAWGLLVCLGGPGLLQKLGIKASSADIEQVTAKVAGSSVRARRRSLAKRRLNQGNDAAPPEQVGN